LVWLPSQTQQLLVHKTKKDNSSNTTFWLKNSKDNAPIVLKCHPQCNESMSTVHFKDYGLRSQTQYWGWLQHLDPEALGLADETYIRSLGLMDKDIGSGCRARPNILGCLHFLLKLVAIGFGVKARPKSIGSGCQKSPSSFWNHKEKRQHPPWCCTVPIALGTTA
jgi:hypothetical protein